MVRAILSVCVVGALTVGCGPTGESSAGPAPAGPPELTLDSVKVARATLHRRVELPAELRPWREVTLFSRVSGYLGRWRTVDGRELDIGDAIASTDGDAGVLAEIAVPELDAQIARLTAESERADAAVAQAALEATAVKAAIEEPRQDFVAAESLVRKAEAAVVAAEADVARARTELDFAAATHERYKRLVAEKSITDQEYDDARTRFEAARSALTAAEARVQTSRAAVVVEKAERTALEARIASSTARHAAAESKIAEARAAYKVAEARLAEAKTLAELRLIRAPFPGLVVRRFIDVGALVQSGDRSATQATPLVTLSDQSRLRVVVDVPEAEVRFLTTAIKGTLRVPELPSFRAELSLSRTTGTLQPDTRSQRIELDVSNAEGRLRSGLYGQAELILETRANVLAVPTAALIGKGSERFAFVAVDGRVARRGVRAGLADGAMIEVQPIGEGPALQEGETLLLPAGAALQVGQPVKLRSAAGSR